MASSAIQNLLRSLDREIWLVTSSDGDHRGGLIATFVSNASIVPESPRMLVGIAKQHHTWQIIEKSGGFLLHLIDEASIDVVWRFGLQTGFASDKFAATDTVPGPGGNPLFTGAIGWLFCKVEASFDIGDRTIYVAEILDGKLDVNSRPLTMKRLLEIAPADRLREMREGLARDSVVDAEAIRAWRSSRVH